MQSSGYENIPPSCVCTTIEVVFLFFEAEFVGGCALGVAEEFPEGRLVGEAEPVGDGFDVHVGAFEQAFGFGHKQFGNVGVDGSAACLLYNPRQVGGGNVQPVGIKGDVVVR